MRAQCSPPQQCLDTWNNPQGCHTCYFDCDMCTVFLYCYPDGPCPINQECQVMIKCSENRYVRVSGEHVNKDVPGLCDNDYNIPLIASSQVYPSCDSTYIINTTHNLDCGQTCVSFQGDLVVKVYKNGFNGLELQCETKHYYSCW